MLAASMYVLMEKQYRRYTVHQDFTPDGGGEYVCSCDAATQGDTCKHLLKVLMMLLPTLQDMDIITKLGSLKGSTQGGMRQLMGWVPVIEVHPHLRPSDSVSIITLECFIYLPRAAMKDLI